MNRLFKIAQTGLTLPTANSYRTPSHNDTIIRDMDNGEVIFTQKRFLERAEK